MNPISLLMAAASSTLIDEWPDLDQAFYEGISMNVGANVFSPYAIHVGDAGTKLFLCDVAGPAILQYDLSTPWSLTSASYSGKWLDLDHDLVSVLHDVWFRPDGLRMYVLDWDRDRIYQYVLGTPWDINTASYETKFYTLDAPQARNFFFKPDGTRLWVSDFWYQEVQQYSLSTPWEIQTASLDSYTDMSMHGTPTCVFLNDNGTRMYMVTYSSGNLYQFNLSTPWELSSATYHSTISTVGVTSLPDRVHMKPDGTRFFLLSITDETIYQYGLG